jgi:N-acylneuraminate cytidylyltransferase
MSQHYKVVALIPARSGSIRLQDKNIYPLAGHPMIAYTIAAALQSGIFADVIVSTDSQQYAEISEYYGAQTPFLRPAKTATATSPDIEWVECTLNRLKQTGRNYDCFSILRLTSPFRLPRTIQRAWQQFISEEGIDSLRAVEKCRQHPGKMWVVQDNRMLPLLPFTTGGQPWHSNQYQALPQIYVQNASLEIAHCRVVFKQHTIAGNVLMPFFTEGYEGFDINNEYDVRIAEELVKNGRAELPGISQKPFSLKKA